jgi:hypothetical protein
MGSARSSTVKRPEAARVREESVVVWLEVPRNLERPRAEDWQAQRAEALPPARAKA